MWFELQINKLLIGPLRIRCEVSELRQRQGAARRGWVGNRERKKVIRTRTTEEERNKCGFG